VLVTECTVVFPPQLLTEKCVPVSAILEAVVGVLETTNVLDVLTTVSTRHCDA